MSSPFKLSITSATLIYLILLSGVIAIIIAWKILPKEAAWIEVQILNEQKSRIYNSKLPNFRLRYSLDETCVRIYADGAIHIHPLVNVQSIEVR